MREQLRAGMQAIERAPSQMPESIDSELHFSVLAGLGSKYLAVGSPATIGLVDCPTHHEPLIACHDLLFSNVEYLRSEDVGVEEALAADIVCLLTSTEFELEWIADATHVNILDDGTWSAGMKQLSEACALTYFNVNAALPRHSHGRLDEVIWGSVSGRMGEEVTALVCLPARS